MTAQATINVTGIGPVEIKTELKEVKLVGALTIDGSYVNVKTKKVSRNQKAAKEASENYAVWLKDLGDGEHFMLIEEEI